MIVRRLVTLMEYKVDEPSAKKTESTFAKFLKSARGLAAVVGSGAVALAFRKVIMLGSDAAETMNVLNESFQENTQDVLDWASTQATALGRSEYALREYAATLGAMLTPMVEVPFESARMSKTLAQLTVDLGSFFNAAESDVLVALKSGIVGETEPMRRFGVVMTQAALDAFALENKLGKTVKQMSEAEKVTLRYQYILAKTTNAQGDAARTAGGFANLSKALVAILRDIGTEIGMVLLPSIESVTAALVGIARQLKGPIVTTVQRAARVFGALANKTTLIITAIAAATIALKAFGSAAVIAWLKVTAPALAAVVLFGLIGLAIFAIIEDLEAMGEGGRSVIGGLIGELQHWYERTDSIVKAIGEILTTAFKYWGESFANLFGDEVAATIKDVVGTISDFVKFLTSGELGKMLGERFEGLSEQLAAYVGTPTLPRQVVMAPPQAAAAAAAAAQTTQTSQQNIEVTVQAAPGMDEARLAGMSGAATGRAVDAANRRTAQRLAVGGGS